MRRALVVGCSAQVWSDVAAARELGDFDAVYCVKSAGVHWTGVFRVWATLHPEAMDQYEAERRALGLPNGYEIVAPLASEVGEHGRKGRVARRVSYRWPGMTGSASSGIYAVKVALDDGYERVVLAGIPMTKESGHFLPEARGVHGAVRGEVWKQRDAFMPGYEIALPHMLGRVRSMSGHTRDTLGAPTSGWLAGDPP